MNKTTCDICIVGGGLSGIALAAALEANGADWRLVESRPRFGGRILSVGAGYDMGPGWTWPGDRRVAALAARLSLSIAPQYAEGRLVFQDGDGQVRRDLDMALMAGAGRIDGGAGRLIEELLRTLPASRLQSDTPVSSIGRAQDGLSIGLKSGATIRAKRVALALPPRVALESIDGLAALAPQAAATIPTWMAGQAKAVAVYDHPFWRDAGLSGEAISHAGPLMQVHDASLINAGEAALIGFLGEVSEDVETRIKTQLSALFGPEAARPAAIHIQNWAPEPETTSNADKAAPGQPVAHQAAAIHEDGPLTWAGAEAALENTGLLEGALAAAERAALRLTAHY